MMEFTLLVTLTVIAQGGLDYFLGTQVLKPTRKRLYFWIIFFMIFYVAEVIAMSRLWNLNPEFITGIYLGFDIPLEELIFFINWVLFILIPWAYFKKRFTNFESDSPDM